MASPSDGLRIPIVVTKTGDGAEQTVRGLDQVRAKLGEVRAASSTLELAGAALGGALGGLASAGLMQVQNALENTVRGAFSLAGRLDDLSTKSGQSVETLQRIGNAASQDGASLESVAEALNNLQRAQSEAVGGSTNLIEAFANLGVNAKELKGLGIEELFFRLADGASTTDDRGKALNATMELLGRSGRTLFGTLEKGREDIQALSEEMGVLSSTSVAELAGAQEAIERFENRVTVFTGNTISYLSRVIDTVREHGLEWKRLTPEAIAAQAVLDQIQAKRPFAQIGNDAAGAKPAVTALANEAARMAQEAEKASRSLQEMENLERKIAEESETPDEKSVRLSGEANQKRDTFEREYAAVFGEAPAPGARPAELARKVKEKGNTELLRMLGESTSADKAAREDASKRADEIAAADRGLPEDEDRSGELDAFHDALIDETLGPTRRAGSGGRLRSKPGAPRSLRDQLGGGVSNLDGDPFRPRMGDAGEGEGDGSLEDAGKAVKDAAKDSKKGAQDIEKGAADLSKSAKQQESAAGDVKNAASEIKSAASTLAAAMKTFQQELTALKAQVDALKTA